jgi:hypothetical protein
VAEPHLEAERFRDDVARGDRQDRARRQAGAEQADAEQRLGIAAGERLQRLGRIGGRRSKRPRSNCARLSVTPLSVMSATRSAGR